MLQKWPEDPAAATDEDEKQRMILYEQAASSLLALALRYKAPIRLSLAASSTWILLMSLMHKYCTVPLYWWDKLQETPKQVTPILNAGSKFTSSSAPCKSPFKQDPGPRPKLNVPTKWILKDLLVQAETDTQNMQ
jgi:hypothetical protein